MNKDDLLKDQIANFYRGADEIIREFGLSVFYDDCRSFEAYLVSRYTITGVIACDIGYTGGLCKILKDDEPLYALQFKNEQYEVTFEVIAGEKL